MFPLNDFHAACCALATVSAAIGYKVSRICRDTSRWHAEHGVDSWASSLLDSSAQNSSTASEKSYEITEPGSLKRKSRDEDLDDQSIEKLERPAGDDPTDAPRKRSKTMSGMVDEARLLLVRSHPPQPPAPPSKAGAPESLHGAEAIPAEADGLAMDHGGDPSVLDGTDLRATSWGTSRVPSNGALTSPLLLIPAVKPSGAFTCFANASSAFATVVASPIAGSKPVWYHDIHSNSGEHAKGLVPESEPPQNHRGAVSVGAQVRRSTPPVAHSGCLENADRSERVDFRDEGYAQDDPLKAQTYTRATCTTVTGEEDEEVRAEVKGAKVFIKRGESDFGDGIIGHVKLLSHKETADVRLVFRRAPVWKVSMSVRLRPAVRCTFDEKEGVLRVVLKEVEECDGASLDRLKESVVVYALKRGKATRREFADFALAVTQPTRLSTSVHPTAGTS
ncbi:uncharacterized protein C8Q71DRAFT_777513 [Rhodofomes roseus]|uniref:RanBD1 domain-containing protein n=1 Tax=Rhodofomes roseus TaxID=34475 RepID=A0ABQ8K6C4_9APHY|nr:uncharacterized protein C8Q71DRAFT_777513 [Rhodofomes roseus]KAH9832653.1 hypothetical protein C8Q71DRAFT_777513 [Rhodofomes roseus]